MKAIPDALLGHLRSVADQPDLEGTRYRLVRELARGGMGTVWVVHDTELDREVALKVLSLPDASEDLAARLALEARILARLEHPNIVPIHDAGTLADGRVFYVMKLVRGRRLDTWAADRPPRAAVLRLFQKVCEAVAFAHAKGIVHRDLKPDNVMVGSFGEALVMDWGIAKVVGTDDASAHAEPSGRPSAPATTEHGAILGTPSYMAPEQARGDNDLIDPRTDVHALGGILYFLLSGRPPFTGPRPVDVVRSVIHDPPLPLRRHDPRLPNALESICTKALAKNREDRYSSAEALAADVDRFLDVLPVEAHRETLLEAAGRVLSKNRVVVLLIMAYLVVRLMLLVFSGR